MARRQQKIDMDNLSFQFLRCIRGQTNAQVERKAGVSRHTIYLLRRGITKYPSIRTMLRVFRAYGWELSFGPKGSTNVVTSYNTKYTREEIRGQA